MTLFDMYEPATLAAVSAARPGNAAEAPPTSYIHTGERVAGRHADDDAKKRFSPFSTTGARFSKHVPPSALTYLSRHVKDGSMAHNIRYGDATSWLTPARLRRY